MHETRGCKLCIIFAAFIGIVSFQTGYKKGSQEDLSYAAKKALSSVVNIFISNRGFNRARNAAGSGVIFSKEGHIVTNTHILTNFWISSFCRIK